ncbi:hypothetical protein H0R92_12550 [Treponema sp. OMZ 840]|uniref:hypothetical protein n=1 Tax=Treponema sp. OMZ 840 TaxID=244313 RepID=UPI003D921D01
MPAAAEPEEKKGLFTGLKDWGKRKLDSIGQGIVGGAVYAMDARLRVQNEVIGMGKVQNGIKDGAGEWRNGLAGQENLEELAQSEMMWRQALEASNGFNLEGHNCDTYCTEVLSKGNKKPADWPDPNQTIVAETKKRKGANYLDYYKDDLVTSPQDGWNAMMMQGGSFPETPHMALVYKKDNGSFSLSHYSSNRVESHEFDSIEALQNFFGYNEFAYLPFGQ